MITDSIIENLVNCKYKAYLRTKKEKGEKKEYELMQDKFLKLYKERFIDSLKLGYGENQLIHDFKFENNSRFRNKSFALSPNIKTEKYDITFDFIEIIPTKLSAHGRSYIPTIISPKENISKIEKLLLCIKYLILLELYGIDCEYGKIVCGNNLKIFKFNIKSNLMESRRLLDELKKIVNNNRQPQLCRISHCKICEFENQCRNMMIKKDALGLLQKINEKNIKEYNNRGLFTIKQLSYTFNPKKRGRRVKTKEKPYYVALKALALREKKVYIYDNVEMPIAKIKIYVDMEGNRDGSFIYLIGVIICSNKETKRYSLWIDDFNEESDMFTKLFSILYEYDDAHIFYFGKYERKVFKRVISLRPPNIVKHLFLYQSTNILDMIYSNIYFPTYSDSLKDIGKYIGCKWLDKKSSGLQSLVWWWKWKKYNNINIKSKLVQYNLEDCIALRRITDFMYSIFNNKISNNSINKLDNIAYAKDIENEKTPWLDKKYYSQDIEIVTKCAYFEYQRNKIFFRTHKNFKKINHRRKKLLESNYRINKVVYLELDRCPKCWSKNVTPIKERLKTKVCFNLKIYKYGLKKWIIKYRAPIYFCHSCQRSVYSIEYGKNQKYGHTLLSWAMHQHVAHNLSLESLAIIAKNYFGLPLDGQKLWRFKVGLAEYYRGAYEKIIQKISKGNLIHIDETKVNFQKGSGYIWVFTNMEEVFYLLRPTRETGFLHNKLKNFEGVLISDFYSGYDSLNCVQQKCLVHLIRDFNNALLKHPLDNELKEFVLMFGKLIKNIIYTVDRFGLKKRYLRKHKKEINRFYKKIRKDIFYSETAEKLRKRLIKYENKLFLFLNYDNIPWNNNNAEHAIKHFAKYRTRVNGRLSAYGSEAYLILLTLYQTCNYKGLDFLDFLLSGKKDIDEFESSYKK